MESLAVCVARMLTSFWPPWRSAQRGLFWLAVLSLNCLCWCIFTPPFGRIGEAGRFVFNNKALVYVLVGLMIFAESGGGEDGI